MIDVFKYLLIFVLCMLLQLMVLDNIYLFGYLNPNLLMVFFLALPLGIHRFFYLILGFAMGLLVDVLYGTGGVYTSAYLFLGFIRQNILDLVITKKGSDLPQMRFAYVEMGKLISFYALSFFTFFMVLFFVEDFTLYNFGKTIVRATISTAFNVVLFVIIEFLISSKKTKPFNA